MRRLYGKSRSDEINSPSNRGVEPLMIRINVITLRLVDLSTSFKAPRDATVIVRLICNQSTTIQTDGLAFASNLAWEPAFEIQMADFTVEVILKRADRFKPDRKLGNFLVNAAQLTSDGQEGICEKTYRSPKSGQNPLLELTISFSGLPTSSTVPSETEFTAAQPSWQQTASADVDHIKSAADHAASNIDALHSLAGLEAGISFVDTVMGSVGQVQSALAHAESLKGTLDCLSESAGYINGVIGLVKDFADIHPISKIAVGALIKVYDLVKKQGQRDESIQTLVSSMRDMLASLSEVKDLSKIQILQSVIIVAMTRVGECVKFIDAYAQHGFWGRLVRQSLSSHTADTIQRFQQSFGELKQKFSDGVSIQTLKVVEVLRNDLKNIGDAFVAQVDKDCLDKLPRSKRAAYDRGLRCLPGTRQDVLSLIYDWLGNKEPGDNIFWLRGTAGSGKSTMASTVAALLDSKDSGLRQLGLGSLGATFFCKRDDNTLNQPQLMFPTIAFRLASTCPLLREGILTSLMANPDIGESSIVNQFQELIVDPLLRLPDDFAVPPVVTIIDAVDECGNKSTRDPLLRCLQQVHHLPVWFKLLVTSRPEPDITAYLAGVPSGHDIDTSSEQTVSDIRAYTQARVVSLRTTRRLGSNWPGDSKVNQLVSCAAGLFIWTTLSFDFMSQQPSPSDALELVLKPTGQTHLDTLYRTVLVQDLADAHHLGLIRSILGCVVVCKIPLSLRSICTVLDLDNEKAEWARDKLASVLPIDSRSTIRVIHPSFLDFLTEQQRSNEFFVDIGEHNLSLARGCLRVMNSKLRTNICRLTDETILNEDISDLASRLAEYVADELAYSCLFWFDHLKDTSNQDAKLLSVVHEFYNKHILHWLEMMSLKAETRKAMIAVRKIQKWLPTNDPSMGCVQDVVRFCSSCGYVIGQSAPYIYMSAAVFAPRDSHISMLSRREFVTLELKTPTEDLWDSGLLTLNGHTDGVLSVAFSPDGKKIVSGSCDETLRVWDAEAGTSILGPLVGHTGAVWSVAFSPDGKKIVSGSEDKTLRVWDAESGKTIPGSLIGHTEEVCSVAFSPDGKKIVSGSDDKTLRVWDAESGSSILGPLVGHTEGVWSVAFSPDGKKIVSGSFDETLRVWDAESGSSVLGPLVGHTGWVRSVAFSPDGKKIVSGSRDKTLRVWDAESGSSILDPLVGHTEQVWSVAFSPDGKKIVSGSDDKTLRVWDAESGSSILGPLVGHTVRVRSVAFSPDGKQIVSGSDDQTLRVWDAESESSMLCPLVGHTGWVWSVALSPDGKKIVSGSGDGTLRVWDAESGSSILGPLVGHTGWVRSVAFSPDGKKIVSGSGDKTLRVWDAESGSCILGPLFGHTAWVSSIAFSPDGTKIASGSGDKTLRVWDAESGSSILNPLVGHTKGVRSVAFSPDGKKIVSGSGDKTLRVWDAESGLCILDPLVGHTNKVQSVAFSPDGKKIVSGSRDKALRVWDAESGLSIVGPLIGHTDWVWSVAFSLDGKKIVSGSGDETLRVWDAESGSSILDPLVGHTYKVQSVAFSPNGKKIVSGSRDKTLRVWDAESGSIILGPLVGHAEGVWSVAFSPDGKKIVSAFGDGTLRVWDAESGSSILSSFVGHTQCIKSVAFSLDGNQLVSGSNDNTLRVWDAESGSCILGPLTGHTDWVESVAFSPDGKKVVSGSGDGTLRVWDAESGSSTLNLLVGHRQSVSSVAFSPNGKKIVSGSSDATLRVWDAESGLCILGPLFSHTGWVRSVAFSPDGNQIVLCSGDETLCVWDAESGSSILNPLVGHIDWGRSVTFSREGDRIMLHSHDASLVLDSQSMSFNSHPLADDIHPMTSTTFSSSLPSQLSSNGWVIDLYCRKMLWIPAHLRGDREGAAVHKTTLTWFNSNHLPMIVTGLGLSWWSCAGAQ